MKSYIFDRLILKKPSIWGDIPNKEIIQITNLIKTGKVLDLGVGLGRNLLHFARKEKYQCKGVDFSNCALHKLKEIVKKENLNIELELNNISSFEFDNKYHIIISNGALHFLPLTDIKDILWKIKKNTIEGGINHISVFTENTTEKNKFSYLFKENELKGFYSDWEIISYVEYTIQRTIGVNIGIARILVKNGNTEQNNQI